VARHFQEGLVTSRLDAGVWFMRPFNRIDAKGGGEVFRILALGLVGTMLAVGAAAGQGVRGTDPQDVLDQT